MPLSRDSTGDKLSPITVEQVKAMIEKHINKLTNDTNRQGHCDYAKSLNERLEFAKELLKEIEEAERDNSV